MEAGQILAWPRQLPGCVLFLQNEPELSHPLTPGMGGGEEGGLPPSCFSSPS